VQKRFAYALTAGLLSSGAPAGLLGVTLARKRAAGVSLPQVGRHITDERASYVSVIATTAIIFGMFGYLLGRKVDALAQLSETDSLTGLLNARGFSARLSRELKRARRYREPLTLLFFDIDGLKDINDRYGHRAGSMALRKVARVIRSELRESDVAARWGGDEYTLIAQKTGLETGMALADRIRHRIAERMAAWPLTASVGAATADPQNMAGFEPEVLLREADLAMYEAKKCGKNSTFAFRPDAAMLQTAASFGSNGSEPTPADRDMTKKI
jgi:diguanylate cyclase (GGDEF)-like protein